MARRSWHPRRGGLWLPEQKRFYHGALPGVLASQEAPPPGAEPPVSVEPSIIRVAELGTMSAATADWVDTGTFDASGSESNRILVIFSEVFVNGNGLATTINSLTIGGTAATQKFAFINTTDGSSRNMGVAIHYRLAPADNAALAVAWDFTTVATITSGKVYGALLQDVHQSDPLPTGAQVNDTNVGPETLVDVSWTTLFDLSLLLGGFMTRGDDTGPHTTRNGSTIEIAGDTGLSASLDTAHSLASLSGGTAGAKTLGVTLPIGDDRGGAAVEVRAA